MKRILVVLGTLCATSSVFAASASVCSGATTAGNGTLITGTVGFTAANSGTTGFVVNAFTPKCSANVHAAIEQNETVLAVASGSSKGKKLFTGSTNGGSVQPGTANFANGVGATDASGSTGVTAALAAAMSS